MKTKDISQPKNNRIVFASVLKPVDEPRMFERMAMSLDTAGYEVVIIGLPPSSPQHSSNIKFLSHFKFKRISWKRIWVRFQILKKIFSSRPAILIICTHELLGVALIYKALTSNKIIYDVQENYRKNILFTDAFPPFLRLIIALFVRLKEKITSPFISHFLIAEKCYAAELGFIKNKFLVIENKCQIPKGFQRIPGNDSIKLIFTGTIAESTGVFKAIELAKKLHVVESKISLTIIGYCAQVQILNQIKEEASKNTFITLIGGRDFVSHSTIMNAIATATFGIIYYPMSPHIENKIPTKLYEYLACQLPILLQNHKPWIEMSDPDNGAIKVDFEHPDINSILNQIHAGGFYSTKPEGMTWESEEKKLLELVDNIF